MGTLKQLIDSSFRLIGVLGEGTTLTYREYNDAINSLNGLIDLWNVGKEAVYTITPVTFPFVPEQQQYTIGPGGNFNVPERPIRIQQVSVIIDTAGLPIELPLRSLTVQEWQSITTKNTPGSYPTCMYEDGAYPLDNLYFWPIPTAPSNVTLYVYGFLQETSSLSSVLTLPVGWEQALRFALAVDLAPEFGKVPSLFVEREAARSFRALANVNHQPVDVGCESIMGKTGMFHQVPRYL